MTEKVVDFIDLKSIIFIRKNLNFMGLSDSQKKIASNIAWALGGKIVNMASALFIGILVARYLGPNNYGIMNYVISYVSIFSIIASFGLDDIEIRELSKHNENRNIILGSCFLLE